MHGILNKMKPAAGTSVLIFLSAAMWLCVGYMLVSMAYSWLRQVDFNTSVLLALTGILAALIIHHFGFLRVVDKNLARILPMQGKRCLFAFMSWKSYLNVVLMIAMGILLRHSPIPKPYLAVLYIAIGLALALSSIRYLRVLLHHRDP